MGDHERSHREEQVTLKICERLLGAYQLAGRRSPANGFAAANGLSGSSWPRGWGEQAFESGFSWQAVETLAYRSAEIPTSDDPPRNPHSSVRQVRRCGADVRAALSLADPRSRSSI
jgi:hypothetical protein